jgi:ankyrin repeat protein
MNTTDLCVVFACVAIAACPSAHAADSDVTFEAMMDEPFGARPHPARATTQTDDELLDADHARIGTVEVERVVERCKSTRTGMDCKPVSSSSDLTGAVLAEAARHGGDQVQFVYEAQTSTRATEQQGECLNYFHDKRVRYQYWTDRWGNRHRMEVTETIPICNWWETVRGEEKVVSARAKVWRHEPELSGVQRTGRAFLDAVTRGDAAAVHEMILDGTPATTMFRGRSALGQAVENGDSTIVRLLLDNGADVEQHDLLDTPLHTAAGEGRADMVHLLVDHGANPDAARDYGEGRTGGSPMFQAAEHGQVEAARALLDAGADPSFRDSSGVTPLMMASLMGQLEVVRTLLDAGASANEISDQEGVFCSRLMKGTPLLFAALGDHADVVLELLDNRADAETYVSDDLKVAEAPCLSSRMKQLLVGIDGIVTGFVDLTGHAAVPPQYVKAASAYSEGLAAVSVDGETWGFIDSSGRWAIEPGFDNVGSFHNGLAAVSVKGMWGFIDSSGEFAIVPRFAGVKRFSEGLAAAQDLKGKWGYIGKDRTGGFVIEPEYDYAAWFSEGRAAVGKRNKSGRIGKVAYIDRSGKTVTKGFDQASAFREGLAQVRDGKQCGYIDRSGNWAIKPQHKVCGSFSEGRAYFRVEDKPKKGDRRYGFIDTTGQVVIEARFDDVGDFSDGLAAVEIGDRWGFIDRDGRISIEPQFLDARSFGGEVAPVRAETGKSKYGLPVRKWGFIDTSGEFVSEPTWYEAFQPEDGMARVQMDDKYWWIAMWSRLQESETALVLLQAHILKGDVQSAQEIIERGLDLDAVVEKTRLNALGAAAFENKLEFVPLLLEAGASVDAPSIDGTTPVMFAAGNGHLGLVRMLVESGADLSAAADDGSTAVMYAARGGHRECLDYLVSEGAETSAVDSNGQTVLMYAAGSGHASLVSHLVDLGLDVNARERGMNASALTFAAGLGHTATVEALLKAGADPGLSDASGWTPLMHAALAGGAREIELLLQHGAEPDASCPKTGDTALIMAARAGHTECVRILLDGGATVNRTNVAEATAWDAASSMDQTAVLEVLKQAGGTSGS